MKYILFFFTILGFGCNCDLNDKKFDLGQRTITLSKFYKTGDTIFFQCEDDFDTIRIVKIEQIKHCGSFSSTAISWYHITIQHLPERNIGPNKVDKEVLFAAEKEALDNKEPDIFFQYRLCNISFERAKLVKGKLLNTLNLKEYWLLDENLSSPRKDSEELVKSIIWTSKFGLTGYYKYDGRFYKIVPTKKN